MAGCGMRRRDFILRGISLHLFAAADGDLLQEDSHGIRRWACRDVDEMKLIRARRLSDRMGLIGMRGSQQSTRSLRSYQARFQTPCIAAGPRPITPD